MNWGSRTTAGQAWLVLPHEIMTTWDDVTTKREIPISGIYNNAYSSKPL